MTVEIDFARLRALREAPTDDFVELVKISGLDPAHDFRHADLAKVDFGTADLAGYDFTGADLRGSDLSQTRNFDRSGVADADLEGAKLPAATSKTET